MEKERHREKERSSHVTMGGRGASTRATPHPPSPASLEPFPASPSIAVHLHRLSGGVLSALVEAGTPFQGHTPVVLPDLRESDPEVLGPQRVIQQPRPEAAQGAHAQSGAGIPALVYTVPPGSAEDTLSPSALIHCRGRSPGTWWRL